MSNDPRQEIIKNFAAMKKVKTKDISIMNQEVRVVLLGFVQKFIHSCISLFDFSSFSVSNFFVDINLFGD